MMKAMLRAYWRGLTDAVGTGWNRFWFAPRDPYPLGVLRVLVGALALAYLLGFLPDLIDWFGPHGLLPGDVVRRLTGADAAAAGASAAVYRFSFLTTDSPSLVWGLHAVAILAAACMTAGLSSRLATAATLVLVLSLIHRGPMITGQFEPVLAMLLLYLTLGPTGACLSLDNVLRRRRRRSAAGGAALGASNSESVAASIVLRLIQVHTAALALMMGLEKLGNAPWWTGEAIWLLIARPESRLIDLTGLHGAVYLLNFWTHAVVALELAFGILVWNRLARPLVLAAAVLVWGSLALVSGLVTFYLAMLTAAASFVPAEAWRRAFGACGEPGGGA